MEFNRLPDKVNRSLKLNLPPYGETAMVAGVWRLPDYTETGRGGCD